MYASSSNFQMGGNGAQDRQLAPSHWLLQGHGRADHPGRQVQAAAGAGWCTPLLCDLRVSASAKGT